MRRIEVTRERFLGDGEKCFVVAEMSANHCKSFERAVQIIESAAKAGADGIKVQTYTPDTITLRGGGEVFTISGESTWAGRTLYDLYAEAYMPWEWQPRLKRIAEEMGLVFFSTPFDPSAVDFLETIKVPLYKIASFELVDLPLIRYVAEKGKPVILSTGMATLDEIAEAVDCVKKTGNDQIILLKCVSAYPAPIQEMNLRTIPDLRERFGCLVGLSDHTLGGEVAGASVALGAHLVEKHFTLDRKEEGPDSTFSMEPAEFVDMVEKIRMVEASLGRPCYAPTKGEMVNRQFRRSLFVVKDMRMGERFTLTNIRSIRPAMGLPPKQLSDVVGRKAACDLAAGTPLKLEHIA
ncbi:MAG: pseudaminic acid synthase [Thermodesulfobacteriota bacterium]